MPMRRCPGRRGEKGGVGKAGGWAPAAGADQKICYKKGSGFMENKRRKIAALGIAAAFAFVLGGAAWQCGNVGAVVSETGEVHLAEANTGKTEENVSKTETIQDEEAQRILSEALDAEVGLEEIEKESIGDDDILLEEPVEDETDTLLEAAEENGETTEGETGQEAEVREFLEGYFLDLASAMRTDSKKDVTHEDFASVRGYAVGKWFVYERYNYETMEHGITDAKVEVDLNSLAEKKGLLDAKGHVRVRVKYLDKEYLEKDHSWGISYEVALSKENDGYKVIDMDVVMPEVEDAQASALGMEAYDTEKSLVEALESPNGKSEEDFQKVDAHCEEWKQILDEANQNKEIEFVEPIDANGEEIMPLSVGVSYNRTKARNYGWKLAEETENYIFKRADPDCTNFISQCVWAGYGGTDGYSIPSKPSLNNEKCVALRARVSADYRMLSGTKPWFGRHYGSTKDIPARFCGVVEFYKYVVIHEGDGPKATPYNNGKLWNQMPVKLRPGDVVQFYSESKGRYSHSAIVVSTTPYEVKETDKILLAQHESDVRDRKLIDAIRIFGGESKCKMRLLRFKTATFPN